MVSVGTSEGCCTGPTVVALAGALMLNETRPLMTWPSVPMRRQRAVTLPDKSGGKSKTISLSVDPCRGAARATRTPLALTTSPDAEARGTDLANIAVHVVGATVRTAPSRGTLSSNELCARTSCGVPARKKNTAPAIARRRWIQRIWAFV